MQNITEDILIYRNCILSIWKVLCDNCKRDGYTIDWDLCDLFADMTNQVFKSYICDKYNISQRKSCQYYAKQTPMRRLEIIPHFKHEASYIKNDITWVENILTDDDKYFFIDFYDYDLLDINRKFNFILAEKNTKKSDSKFLTIFNYFDVDIFDAQCD